MTRPTINVAVFVWLLAGWLLHGAPAAAQTTVQVITKVIEKEIAWQSAKPIVLMAQKADITVRGWNRPVVSIRLRLVAKNPNRATAEHDLTYHQYTIRDGDAGIEIGNRFVIPMRDGAVRSQLKAVIEVSMPANAGLTITDSFGDISLRDLTGDVSLKTEFGKLTLANLSGTTFVQTSYADVLGNAIAGGFTARITNADAFLYDLGGTAKLRCIGSGNLSVRPDAATLTALTIEADQTQILLQPERMTDFRYDIETQSAATIRVPTASRPYLSSRRFLTRPGPALPENQPGIRVRANSGPVMIEPLTGPDATASEK